MVQENGSKFNSHSLFFHKHIIQISHRLLRQFINVLMIYSVVNIPGI